MKDGEHTSVLKRECQTGYFHVCCRGNNRATVYYDDEDVESHKEFLQRYAKEYSVIFEADCFMRNHFHIQLYADGITDFMRAVNVKYSYWHHNKYRQTGRLFETPFNRFMLGSQYYRNNSLLYILQNPLRAGACTDLSGYKWCSFLQYFKNPDRNLISGKMSKLGGILSDYILDIDNEFVRREYATFDCFKEKIHSGFVDFISKDVAQRNCGGVVENKEFAYNWRKISDAEVILTWNQMLDGRLPLSISFEERMILIERLIRETNASIRQIAAVVNESYELIRRMRMRVKR